LLHRPSQPRWRDIFSSNGTGPYSPYGSDTNFALLESTLEAVHSDVEVPDAIVVTGDFIAHDFRTKFNKTVAHHDDADHRLCLTTGGRPIV